MRQGLLLRNNISCFCSLNEKGSATEEWREQRNECWLHIFTQGNAEEEGRTVRIVFLKCDIVWVTFVNDKLACFYKILKT